MIVTRFNPSATGNLHLGHIYTLLVNERLAHQQDGKCFVRFDDTSQAITIEMNDKEKGRVPQIIRSQVSDIDWLGIKIDGWMRQTDFVAKRKQNFDELRKHLVDPYPHRMPISIRMGSKWMPYPYAPYQTAERVLMDKYFGVTHLIRGDDFFCEYSLYYYFCDTFNFHMPEYILLPRLVNCRGENISKTNGGYTIAELRSDGYTPEDVIRMIEKACLIWPPNGWSIYNLKREPRLSI
jgi:glutamyl/glutaminyl-tRNA synthetase